MLSEPLYLFIAMTATIAFAHILEGKFRWAKRIGSVMIIILLAIILSNAGVVAAESPIYNITFSHIIPFSISLLLLRLSIKDIRRLDKKLLLYFFLGSAATVAGAFVTFLLFRDLVGPEAWKLAGQLTASYIGGGENAVAVSTALGVSKDLFTSAFAADNIVTALWMLVCLSAPVGLSKFFTSRMPESEIEHAKEYSEPFTAHEILPSIFYSLTVAGVIVAVSELIEASLPVKAAVVKLAALFGLAISDTAVITIPSIIWVTTFSLLVAQTPIQRKLKVSYMLGTLMFNYFFFTIGAISSVGEVLRLGPPVFVFVITVVIVHGIIVIGVGRLIKADFAQLFVASQANIGGPSTACALAEANEWPHLVIPGILMGVIGYAIANYIGFIVAAMLR